MAKINVAPTKSNLLATKEQLSVASSGYNLLHQKSDILLMELMTLVEKIKLIEKSVNKQVEKSYGELKKLFLVAGGTEIQRLASSVHYDFSFEEKKTSIAGMSFSTLEAEPVKQDVFFSMLDSYAQTSAVSVEFFKLLELLTDLASIRTIAWRLAMEIKKNQRRVNALEKVVIPQAKETKTYIENVLEERERENVFVLKALKSGKRKKE
ncbi:MAG: V-type ATP synthase subunit D [Spirochaetaceae bacterium]|jgi:V/A-type H+-transporting ATPase subunit D|nr:V-type ATP synthase subunit D [Spirochaetaceae bacterium]